MFVSKTIGLFGGCHNTEARKFVFTFSIFIVSAYRMIKEVLKHFSTDTICFININQRPRYLNFTLRLFPMRLHMFFFSVIILIKFWLGN
jgi:hypothetical protein